MGVLQATQTAQANREARKEETTLKLDQRKQELIDKAENDAKARQEKYDQDLKALELRFADKRETQKLQQQFLASQKEADRENRRAMAELAQASKPLPAGIQKAEDADYDAAQAAINLATDADKYLKSIRGGDIKFGLKDKLSIAARSAMGSNDADVVARNDFERFKTTLTNESLRLNKGTQTEGDAKRALKELEGAESANDAAKAIQTLRDLNARRAGDYKTSIERRRANAKLPMPEMIFESPKFEPHAFTDAEERNILTDPKYPAGTTYINAKGQRMTKTQARK
jgi:hypothetical protein